MRIALTAFWLLLFAGIQVQADNSPPGLPTATIFSITGPAATATGTTEQVLGTYSLPALAFDTGPRQLRITACFKHGATTNSVTSKLYFGTVLITDAGFATNGGVVCLFGYVLRTGSSTQNVIFWGFKAAALLTPTFTAATQADGSPIVIKATGTDAVSAANDDTLEVFSVEYLD